MVQKWCLARVKHREQSPEFTRYLCNPSKHKSERTTGQKLKGNSSTSTKKTAAPITTEEQDMKKDKQLYNKSTDKPHDKKQGYRDNIGPRQHMT